MFCGNTSGYRDHTCSAFDRVLEGMLFNAFFCACPFKFIPVFYNEARYCVATQYLLAHLMNISHSSSYNFTVKVTVNNQDIPNWN